MPIDDALAIIRDALLTAERLNDDQIMADLLRWEVHLREMHDERPSASSELRSALERLGRVSGSVADDVHLSLRLFEAGRMLWTRGEYAASLVSLEQATEAMERRGDAIGISMAESYKGANRASLGDFEAAAEHMRVARELAEGGDRLAMIDYRLAQAGVDAIRGDFEASVQNATDCLETSTELGALSCATISGVVLGGAQIATGRGADARRTLERSLELASQGFLAPLRPRATALMASADGLLGDPEASALGFQAAIDDLSAMGNMYGLAETHLLRGLVLASDPEGDPAAALADLDAARTVFESLGARPDLARAMRARGMVLAALGRVGEADHMLSSAAASAADMGLLDGPWPSDASGLGAADAVASPLHLVD